MAYIYLLNLYEKIDDRLSDAKQTIDADPSEKEKVRFLEGRIQVLSEFKEFLTDNLNSKLPRKIRNQLQKKP
ncbi:MAG: hypothetical protein GY707_04595 [Desulfobacteraceae bacterium]|nr:hypothetical protein [Desulfobacteraceae bacterium]